MQATCWQREGEKELGNSKLTKKEESTHRTCECKKQNNLICDCMWQQHVGSSSSVMSVRGTRWLCNCSKWQHLLWLRFCFWLRVLLLAMRLIAYQLDQAQKAKPNEMIDS